MFTNQLSMHLHITPNRLISEVQKEFNRLFPFLKIEFFSSKSFTKGDYSAKHLLPQNRRVGDGQAFTKGGNIEITEEMRVNELERLFKDQFSLAVQVFRKSGNLWLETTMTDNWTLQQQNNHGKEISTHANRKDSAEDFDLKRDDD